MDVQFIKNVVANIEGMKDDDEAAHCTEDALWLTVLCAIAGGASNAQALAAEAIKTVDIKFARRYTT